MLWPTKPHDIKDRIDGMAPERAAILRWITKVGGELTYHKLGKATVWRAAFPDSGGAFNVYERRQDCLTPRWVLEIGLAERMPFAEKIQADLHERITAAMMAA